MKHQFFTAAAVSGLALIGTPALADCGLPSGEVRLLSNVHSSVQLVVDRLQACDDEGFSISANLNGEHDTIQVPALTGTPAEYQVVVIANSSLSSLLTQDLVRPLDDLIAQYGDQLAQHQLIRVDGETVAVAFMANAQHLFYREDVLEEVGLEPPTSYEEVIEAAEAIRAAGIMEYPLAATMTGWSLGQEFVNMYLGYGGQFFEPGSAEAAIDMDLALQALDTLKQMTEYMNPDFLTFNSDAIMPIWEAGEVAMANLWGSQAVNFNPEDSPSPEIAAATRLAAAPTVGGRDVPATTVWWDGFAIARNISDEDAAVAFQAMMVGFSPEMAAENPNAAVWLIDGYEPTPSAAGVYASVAGGAPGYSMLPYMGLLHDAFSNNLTAFFTGRESAEQSLQDALRDYEVAARQGGFLD